MGKRYVPAQREPTLCICGHRIEDHGNEPDMPCLYCDECGCFCEDTTLPLISIYDIEEKD